MVALELRNRILWNYEREFESRYVTHFWSKIIGFHGQLLITSHLLLWTTFCRVLEFESDSPCWWQPSWSEMQIPNLHDCWDRNESVLILVHGESTLSLLFIKKVRDIKKLTFSSHEQAWIPRNHGLWKGAWYWTLQNAFGPLFFKIHKSPCCRPFKDLHGPMPKYNHPDRSESPHLLRIRPVQKKPTRLDPLKK